MSRKSPAADKHIQEAVNKSTEKPTTQEFAAEQIPKDNARTSQERYVLLIPK